MEELSFRIDDDKTPPPGKPAIEPSSENEEMKPGKAYFLVDNYHTNLQSESWYAINRTYATRIQKYYGTDIHLPAEAIADHKEYSAKYTIDRQRIDTDLFEVTPLAGGQTRIRYPILYDITSKSTGRQLGYLLECTLVLNANEQITEVTSKILKRFKGPTPSGYKVVQSYYGDQLTEEVQQIVQVYVADYHDQLAAGDFNKVMKNYATTVDFHSFGEVGHGPIEAEHQRYSGKFNIISCRNDSDIWLIRHTENGIRATYQMDYNLLRRSDRKTLLFRLENELLIGSEIKIEEVKSKILSRH